MATQVQTLTKTLTAVLPPAAAPRLDRLPSSSSAGQVRALASPDRLRFPLLGSASSRTGGDIEDEAKEQPGVGNAEAQWVISVLNECVTNMNILSSLTPEIMVEPLFRQLDPELILTFQDHFAIEKEYVSVEERLSERPSASDERRLLNLDAQYADSTRTICRVLKNNTLLLDRLRELVPLNSRPGTMQFLKAFSRLRGLLVKQVQLTAEEEVAMKQKLEKITKQNEAEERRFIEEKRSFDQLCEQHQSIIRSRDEQVERLNRLIEEVKRDAQAKRLAFNAQIANENDAAARTYSDSEKSLSAQLVRAQQLLKTKQEENWVNEQTHHRKIRRREEEVAELLSQYDSEMTEKHKHHQDLLAAHAKESNELRVLQHYFSEVDAERRRFEEEIAEIRAARDQELVVERRRQATSGLVLRMFQSNVLIAPPPAKQDKRGKSADPKKKKS